MALRTSHERLRARANGIVVFGCYDCKSTYTQPATTRCRTQNNSRKLIAYLEFRKAKSLQYGISISSKLAFLDYGPGILDGFLSTYAGKLIKRPQGKNY